MRFFFIFILLNFGCLKDNVSNKNYLIKKDLAINNSANTKTPDYVSISFVNGGDVIKRIGGTEIINFFIDEDSNYIDVMELNKEDFLEINKEDISHMIINVGGKDTYVVQWYHDYCSSISCQEMACLYYSKKQEKFIIMFYCNKNSRKGYHCFIENEDNNKELIDRLFEIKKCSSIKLLDLNDFERCTKLKSCNIN